MHVYYVFYSSFNKYAILKMQCYLIGIDSETHVNLLICITQILRIMPIFNSYGGITHTRSWPDLVQDQPKISKSDMS